MRKKLDDMLAGMTLENRHVEVDFGEAVGRENIADSLPRRLDEIVTRNCDQVEIRLATDTEVAALGEFLGSPKGSEHPGLLLRTRQGGQQEHPLPGHR